MGYPNTCPDCGGHFDPGHTCPTPGGAVSYLQRQLRKAERQALLNLGQAWQREDITQAQLQQALADLERCRETLSLTCAAHVETRAERDRAVRELVAEVGRGHEWDEKYDAAIERAEAAEERAKKRLNCGLAVLDILRVVLDSGVTTVTVGRNEWRGFGTARVLTAPAEAQARQKEGGDA